MSHLEEALSEIHVSNTRLLDRIDSEIILNAITAIASPKDARINGQASMLATPRFVSFEKLLGRSKNSHLRFSYRSDPPTLWETFRRRQRLPSSACPVAHSHL